MSTVLLVDDDLDNRCALQLALESGGHHVVLAANGHEALSKLVRHFPQLIVTDSQMPNMDGAELCRRLECNPALAKIPVVMLSAMPEPAEGAPHWSAFFRKPADLRALMGVINSFIAERLMAPHTTPMYPGGAASRWQPIEDRCWP